MILDDLLQKAAKAKAFAGGLSSENKNILLQAMAESLISAQDSILCANQTDMQAAANTLSESLLDRLLLNEQRIACMAQGLLALCPLPDPVGQELSRFTHSNGLSIRCVRVPMGVVAMIYESRPNVTADAAGLCLKSGNACVLRGGREALRTNRAIVDALHSALKAQHAPAGLICLVEDSSHESAHALMRARGRIDLLIPRGGRRLIEACVREASVPCIETGTGICHIYIHKDAELSMALDIVDNAKNSRPSVCNAAEVCLVHADCAPRFLPVLAQRMQQQGTQLRLCSRAAALIDGVPADAEDFDTEFLDKILAVKLVDGLDDALAHIAAHSTHHSEAIITQSQQDAARFQQMVDSAAVYVNASTRFTDGGEFGLGCEMGISTQKLGTRGPMGLCALTSTKYLINGSGQIRC